MVSLNVLDDDAETRVDVSVQRSVAKVAFKVELETSTSDGASSQGTELDNGQSWVGRWARSDEWCGQRVDLGETERSVEWRGESNVRVDLGKNCLCNPSDTCQDCIESETHTW